MITQEVFSKSTTTFFSIQQFLLPHSDILKKSLHVCLTIPGDIKVQHVQCYQENKHKHSKDPLPTCKAW